MKEQNQHLARRFAALLCMGAAMAPALWVGIKSSEMSRLELWTSLAIMGAAAAIGYFIAARRPVVGLVVAPLCTLALSYVCVYSFEAHRHAQLAALRDRLADYTDIALPERADARGEDGDMLLKGKVVVIDHGKKDFDPLHLLLPDKLRADAPAEVGTVVWLDWDDQPVQGSPQGGIAYRRVCDVRVINFSDPPRLVVTKRFFGTDPRPADSTSSYGAPPYPDVIAFLESMSN